MEIVCLLQLGGYGLRMGFPSFFRIAALHQQSCQEEVQCGASWEKRGAGLSGIRPFILAQKFQDTGKSDLLEKVISIEPLPPCSEMLTGVPNCLASTREFSCTVVKKASWEGPDQAD